MKVPKGIKIFDVEYPVKYFNTPIEVDLEGKKEFVSQWDVQNGMIRIHHGERPWKAVTQSLWGIVVEIICKHMIIEFGQREETIIERLAVGLNTVMFFVEDKQEGMKLADETKKEKE